MTKLLIFFLVLGLINIIICIVNDGAVIKFLSLCMAAMSFYIVDEEWKKRLNK